MLKRVAFKAVSRLVLQPYYRQARGMTLGTRIVVLSPEGGVLLVRHTYAPGWLLPGGGVERGETVVAAAIRELREEACIHADAPPVLMGIYLNDRQFPGDHVACFVLRQFRQMPFRPTAEIAEARFHDLTALPEGTTAGTRRRIAEACGQVPEVWDW
ncbi:MAG: NUDIX domain-containing protein [Alphaproteobacteria bacterium]|nr:NUDIX domain-containing protein [Chrysiogenetes bacterium]MCB1378922.1 NUDIX domain-containing protein [Alphaproteobacteria bacterium]